MESDHLINVRHTKNAPTEIGSLIKWLLSKSDSSIDRQLRFYEDSEYSYTLGSWMVSIETRKFRSHTWNVHYYSMKNNTFDLYIKIMPTRKVLDRLTAVFGVNVAYFSVTCEFWMIGKENKSFISLPVVIVWELLVWRTVKWDKHFYFWRENHIVSDNQLGNKPLEKPHTTHTNILKNVALTSYCHFPE